jgi:hypothetical protein
MTVPNTQTPPAAAAAPPQAPQTPIDGVQDSGLVQGSLHPGDINAPAPANADAAAQAAALSAAQAAAATQLPPGQVTPEAAAVASNARAIAAEMGFAQANQFQDDRAFVQALLEASQQGQHAQQQLQTYQQAQLALAQAQTIARQQQQQAAQPPAVKANAIWNPPEWNPSWNGLVTKDDKGNPTLIPGAPAEILPKYLAYQNYRSAFAEKFLGNPEETLLPLINQTAEQRAVEIVKRELAAQQEQAHIQGFVRENSQWLHARDAQGQVLRTPQGQLALSPAGQAFQRYVVEAANLGIGSAHGQQQYATGMLQRDVFANQAQTAGQQQQVQQQVVEANRRPNGAGMTVQQGVAPPPAAGQSLQDMLIQAMRTHGINDENLGM